MAMIEMTMMLLRMTMKTSVRMLEFRDKFFRLSDSTAEENKAEKFHRLYGRRILAKYRSSLVVIKTSSLLYYISLLLGC